MNNNHPSIGYGPLADAAMSRSPAPRIPRARTTWWPRRRAESEPVAIGYESGWVAGSFETVDTLGDTQPGDLRDEEAAHRRRESMATKIMLTIVAGSVLAWYFGYIA